MQKKDSPHSLQAALSIAPNLSVLVVIIVVLLIVILVVLVILLVVLVLIVIILIVVIVHEFHLLISTSIVCLRLGKLYL